MLGNSDEPAALSGVDYAQRDESSIEELGAAGKRTKVRLYKEDKRQPQTPGVS